MRNLSGLGSFQGMMLVAGLTLLLCLPQVTFAGWKTHPTCKLCTMKWEATLAHTDPLDVGEGDDDDDSIPSVEWPTADNGWCGKLQWGWTEYFRPWGGYSTIWVIPQDPMAVLMGYPDGGTPQTTALGVGFANGYHGS